QSVMGGTGANHVMLGSGDAIWFTDSNGNPAQPPHNQLVAGGTPNAGIVDEIENPNPQPGTNNWYAKMATVVAPTALPPTAAEPTRTVSTPLNQASLPSPRTWARSADPSIPTAKTGTIIC